MMDMDTTTSEKVVFDLHPGIVSLIPVRQNADMVCYNVKHFADEPFHRNFVVSCTDVFVAAQKAYESHHPDPITQQMAASLSQMYRGLLLELIGNLNSAGDIESATLYTNLEFVWHFCEIMFISSHPELPILPYLLDWVRVNFDDTPQVLSSIDLSDMEPENSEKLWNLIVSQIVHGQTKEAAKLLPFLSAANSNRNHFEEQQVNVMLELLQEKPIFIANETSVTVYEAEWGSWKEVCDSRLKDRSFHGNDKLIFICNLLIGHEDGFQEVLEGEHVRSWYEYMAMTIEYRFPTIRPSALKGFARKTIESVCAAEELSPKDNMLLYAMDYDIVNVLKEVQNHWHHPWFALHFSDLIFGGGQFSSATDIRMDYSSVGPMRDHFLLDYGTLLVEHDTLWMTGFKYLEATATNDLGKAFIREFIQRKKPKCEIEAHKLIMIAEKFSFSIEIHGICKEVALAKLRLGQLQNALLWAIKSGDGPLTTFIVDEILFDGDYFVEPALMASLRNAVPCSNRLLFLNSYCDFRNLMDKKDFKGAIALLIQLIKDDLIPKRIAPKILLTVRDLNESHTKLDTEQISTLMQFLHSKIGSESLGREESTKISTILMCQRGHEIIQRFKNRKINQL